MSLWIASAREKEKKRDNECQCVCKRASVTKLGYFWKVLETNFLAKVDQIFGNHLANSKNLHFLTKRHICLGNSF